MQSRYTGASEEMRNALSCVAPGTALRDGIDSILGNGADCVPIPFIRDCPAG